MANQRPSSRITVLVANHGIDGYTKAAPIQVEQVDILFPDNSFTPWISKIQPVIPQRLLLATEYKDPISAVILEIPAADGGFQRQYWFTLRQPPPRV